MTEKFSAERVRKRLKDGPPDLRAQWQKDQGARCGCKGQDDLCSCQNENPWPRPVIDWQARAQSAEAQLSALKSENERLNQALKWEENRSGRIGTHGPGCAAWGPRHYECLVAEYSALKAKVEGLAPAVKEVEAARTNEAMCFAMDGLLIAARQVLDAFNKGGAE